MSSEKSTVESSESITGIQSEKSTVESSEPITEIQTASQTPCAEHANSEHHTGVLTSIDDVPSQVPKYI